MSAQYAQTSKKVCHHCHKEIPWDTRILRTETCPWCASDLHVCLNCKFHDVSRHNECLVPNTDRVKERDRANYCNDFVFRDGEPEDDRAQIDAKANLANLFKI